MNERKSKCTVEREPAAKNSIATLSAVLPKYDQLETKSQNAQCGMQSGNKPRTKFSWRRLLSYLPSWFKTGNPDSPVSGIETAASTKPSPAIQICHAKACTPVEICNQHMQHDSTEKRSLKKPSHERILSSFNFEDVTSDQKTCCECCKQKGLTVCGKHSFSTDSSNNKTSKPIQIGVAEVSSQKGTKAQSSCGCDDDTNRPAQKTLIKMTSPSCCKQCMGKHPSTNSTCRESLLEQAWGYLQSLISAHRSGCQRCNQRRSNDINARTSNESNTCKESLLEQAVSYLKKITSDHMNGCPRCQQQPSSCNSSETTSYLQTMLEQAWLYLKKLGSDHKTCCERCKQSGRRVCCKHSTTRQSSTNANQNQGILKHPSNSSGCRCSSQASVQEFPQKHSCPAQNQRPSCPKICQKKSPQPPQPIPHLCRSSEERTFDKESCYIPYCKQNSKHSRLTLTGSHHKSCCLSQFSLDAQKPVCTRISKKSFDSIDVPIDCNTLGAPNNRHSSQSIISQEILEYRSSAKCTGPCGKSNSNNNETKQGISLSQEPNDHKFCTRPKECKHSKQSMDRSRSLCNDGCSGVCRHYKPPEEDEKPKKSSCSGGCVKCNTSYTATAPMYQEQRMVDADYEAFLDEQYGKMVAKQFLDKETVCEEGCSCVSCIDQINPPDKCNDQGPKSDPHNYRFYY